MSRAGRRGFAPIKRMQKQRNKVARIRKSEQERRDEEQKMADYKPPKSYGPGDMIDREESDDD